MMTGLTGGELEKDLFPLMLRGRGYRQWRRVMPCRRRGSFRRSGVICFFCEDVAGAKRAAVGG